MLFNVERDLGDVIVFYVVPDAFSAVPSVRLSSQGAVVLELEANEQRQALVAAGRHESGRCAFAVDSDMAPGLAGMEDLTITDVETGLLIYRRPGPNIVRKKVLNLSAGLFPPRMLNATLQDHFQYAAIQLERHGHETVNQLFHLHDVPSMFLSGRIMYKNYEYLIENQFDIFLFIDEPYQALAERLLILSKLEKMRNPEMLLGERDAMLYQPAIAFARDLDMTDGRMLRRAFRSMPDDVAVALVNPQVRMLTTSTPAEMARDNAMPKALDVLASSSAIGIARERELFADMIAAHLGLDPSEVSAQQRFAGVEELAVLLREHGKVEHVIDKDLELYAITESAFSKST